MPKRISQMLFILNVLHGELCGCVKYSILEYFHNLSFKAMLNNKWLDVILNVNFMTLTILKFVEFFIFLEFVVHLRSSSNIFVENVSI